MNLQHEYFSTKMLNQSSPTDVKVSSRRIVNSTNVSIIFQQGVAVEAWSWSTSNGTRWPRPTRTSPPAPSIGTALSVSAWSSTNSVLLSLNLGSGGVEVVRVKVAVSWAPEFESWHRGFFLFFHQQQSVLNQVPRQRCKFAVLPIITIAVLPRANTEWGFKKVLFNLMTN